MKRIWFGLLQAGVCGLVMGLMLLVGGQFSPLRPVQAADDIPQVVKAHSFQVVDNDGKVRATMGMTEEGIPAIRLLDTVGRRRVSILISQAGIPTIALGDTAGKIRGGLFVTADNIPGIALFDAGGKGGAVISQNWIGLKDERGTSRISMSLDGGTTPDLRLNNTDGAKRCGFTVNDGAGELTLDDMHGRSLLKR